MTSTSLVQMRHVLVVVVFVLAAWCAPLAPAAATQVPGYTSTDVVAEVNAARADYGESPVSVQPWTVVDGVTWVLDPTQSAGEALSEWPELAARLIDPRSTSIGLTTDAKGAVRIKFGQSGAFATGLVVPQRLDPADPMGFTFFAPDPISTVTVSELRGTQWVPLRVTINHADLSGPTDLVQLGSPSDDGLQIAYATQYQVVIDGQTLSYTSAPIPPAFRAISWAFTDALSSSSRAAWLLATSNLAPLAQRVIGAVDGAVLVSRRSCGGEDSCATWIERPLQYTIWIAPADFQDGGRDLRFVAIHEIGHIVDFLGFDDQARAAFKALFQSSARWKACFPDPFANKHACLPFSEVFADQFAYWITGYPAEPTGGYEDPPLVSRAAFGHLIGSQFAFRPPYWRNPAR